MENLKGSNYSWGLVAKIFHWTLAVFILSQILFGINLHFMDPSRDFSSFYFITNFIWY